MCCNVLHISTILLSVLTHQVSSSLFNKENSRPKYSFEGKQKYPQEGWEGVQRYYRHFYIFPKHFTWHLWALFWQRGQATAGDSRHVSDVILGCTILLLYFYTVINGHLNKCVVSNWDLCPQSFIDGQFSGFLGCLTKQPINENWLVFYKKNALEKHCRPSLTCLGDMFHSLHGAVCWRGQWQVKQWSSS